MTHSLCFEQKYEKYQNFLSENFKFWVIKYSVYLNRHVFVMNKKNVYLIAPIIESYDKVQFLALQLCIHLPTVLIFCLVLFLYSYTVLYHEMIKQSGDAW